jgi:hypothetical protein
MYMPNPTQAAVERPLTSRDAYKLRKMAESHLDEARALFAEAQVLDRCLARGEQPTKIALARTRICTRCEAPFRMTPDQQRWFRERELALPRRCPACREALRSQDGVAPLDEQLQALAGTLEYRLDAVEHRTHKDMKR